MAAAPPPEDESQVEDEWAWLKLPGTFCDWYTFDIWRRPRIVRIAFGEYLTKGIEPFYRTGVAMPLEDAKKLAEGLVKAIARFERDEKERQEKKQEIADKPEE